jgi:hypothetical protein
VSVVLIETTNEFVQLQIFFTHGNLKNILDTTLQKIAIAHNKCVVSLDPCKNNI